MTANPIAVSSMMWVKLAGAMAGAPPQRKD